MRDEPLTLELLVVLFLPLLISSADSDQFSGDSSRIFKTVMSVPSLEITCLTSKPTTEVTREIEEEATHRKGFWLTGP